MYGGTVSDDDLKIAELRKKVPDLKGSELDIKGVLSVRELPCEAPWLSPIGACLIMITDIRRGSEGKLEFQLGDEDATPYDGGSVWATADAFYEEWPD